MMFTNEKRACGLLIHIFSFISLSEENKDQQQNDCNHHDAHGKINLNAKIDYAGKLNSPDMNLVQSHIFLEHAGAVYGLCAGRSGRTFFSVSADRYVAEWDLSTLKQTGTAIRLEDHGYTVCYDESRQLLCVGTSTGALHVIDLVQKREIRNLTFHTRGLFDLKLDRTAGRLFAAGGDGVLSVWDFPSMELMRAIPLTSEKLRQLALHPVEDILAVACGDGVVRVLEMEGLNEVAGIDAHRDGATSVAWHPRKPVLLSGGKDAMLRVWNRTEGYNELLSMAAHRYAIYTILFDPQEDVFYTGSRDGSIKMWNATALEVVQRLESRAGGHSHSVNKLITVGDALVSGGDDRRMIVWKRVI